MDSSGAAPFLLQSVIENVFSDHGFVDDSMRVLCAQASGPEIYLGCLNGELLRFVAQAPDGQYTLLSRQTLPGEKSIDDIVLLPSLGRVLILSDHQVHFYTLPSLDPVSEIKPIRNVVTFAVDDYALRRLYRPGPVEPAEICIMKRSSIALFALRSDRLAYQREIPLPAGATFARRSGGTLCYSDKENYNLLQLATATLLPVLPLSQAPPDDPTSQDVKPAILVTGDNEFLMCSWTGSNSLGLFITGDGDPVRGTLEFKAHPQSLSYEYPHINVVLSDGSIEIYDIDQLSLVQSFPAPASQERKPLAFAGSPQRFVVPTMKSEKTEKVAPPPFSVHAPSGSNQFGDLLVQKRPISISSLQRGGASRTPVVQKSKASVNLYDQDFLGGFAADLTEAKLNEIRIHSSVEHIEENGIMFITVTQTDASWGPQRISQTGKTSKDLTFTYRYDCTAGAGMDIYVLDKVMRMMIKHLGHLNHPCGFIIKGTYTDHASIGSNGTSMATPHVASLAAYLISQDGNKSPAALAAYITSLANRDAISGVPPGTPNLLANNGFK